MAKITTLQTKLSPSNMPTNISFTSSDIVIKALSSFDRRVIPFVEWLRLIIKLTVKYIVGFTWNWS